MLPTPETKSPFIGPLGNGLEHKSFAELYRLYSPSLYAAVNRLLKNTTLSQDVLQNTFIKIWQHQASFDSSKGTAFTWMLNIARNEAIDTLRSKRQKQAMVTVPLPMESHCGSNPFGHLDHIDVHKLLCLLKPMDRAILELCFFRGYSCSQVAELLCLPCGSVKTRMQLSYKVLKAALTESNPTHLF